MTRVRIGSHWGAAALACAVARCRLPRRPRIFSRRCSAASSRRPRARCFGAVRERGRPMPRHERARVAMAAARPFACAPATDVIFRSPAPTMPAGRRPAAVFVRRAKPNWSMAAISTMPRPRPESPIRNCRTRSAIATRSLPGCTCNGKDQIGLAPVKIEDDPTLRKGDIVAGEDGLQVVGRSDRRGASLNFSPASDKIRAKYDACRWWRRSECKWSRPYRLSFQDHRDPICELVNIDSNDGRQLSRRLRFAAAGGEDVFGIAVRLLAALEDQVAGRPEGDAVEAGLHRPVQGIALVLAVDHDRHPLPAIPLPDPW